MKMYLTCFAVFFARSVGKSRKKHKIDYPHMTGDLNFERVLRAQ